MPTMDFEHWRGRSVLVTGVGGFVGSGLAEDLVRKGASVVGILPRLAGKPTAATARHRGPYRFRTRQHHRAGPC